MGDEYGSDDPMSMGVDSSGQAEHHGSSETVGEMGGIHGVHVEDHPADPDGTPVPDAPIPTEHHHTAGGNVVEEKLKEAYDEVTHPGSDGGEPDALSEQDEALRQEREGSDNPAAHKHVVHLPEQHF